MVVQIPAAAGNMRPPADYPKGVVLGATGPLWNEGLETPAQWQTRVRLNATRRETAPTTPAVVVSPVDRDPRQTQANLAVQRRKFVDPDAFAEPEPPKAKGFASRLRFGNVGNVFNKSREAKAAAASAVK